MRRQVAFDLPRLRLDIWEVDEKPRAHLKIRKFSEIFQNFLTKFRNFDENCLPLTEVFAHQQARQPQNRASRDYSI